MRMYPEHQGKYYGFVKFQQSKQGGSIMFETTHLRGAGARLTFFVVVLAGLICIRGKAAWAQIAPAAYAGVLTRWQTSDSTACTGATVNGSPVYTSPCSVQNAFYTPTPNLFGVSLTDWYNNL